MKKLNIRRTLAAMLALLMALSMTVTAFAAEPGGPTDRPDLAIIASQFVNWDGSYELPNLNELSEEDQELVKAMVNAAMVASEAEAQTGAQPTDGTEAQTQAIPIETETTPVTDDELLPAVTGFSDVPSTHGFYTAIMDCAAKGITSGYADGTFRPTNSVTKAQFSVMLSRAFYPDKVKALSTEENKAVAWYYPNVLALKNAGVLKNVAFANFLTNKTIMDQAIPRYQMAQLMTNIMSAKGFSATAAQKAEAQKKIADYKTMPTKYQDAVKNVFALGIITGYSNGTFGGNNIMNRGQGCVVIYRMTKYTPAAVNPTPDTDDSGKPTGGTGNTGNTDNTGNTGTGTGTQTPTQPETPAAKTLSNGKPVTEANVLALLNELKAKYPEGTNFANGYSKGNTSTDIRTVTNTYKAKRSDSNTIGRLSTTAGCGGWMAMASDYIFGQSGFPLRKIAFRNARPGDILLVLDNLGNITHVKIITSRPHHEPECELWRAYATDASAEIRTDDSTYTIYWSETYGSGGEIEYDDGYLSNLHAVYTRYPS